MKERIIGLIGAMPQELEHVVTRIEDLEVSEKGNREYYKGRLNGHRVVAVFSRGGKVAAAITVTTLILEFEVDEVIFTGVAGAVNPDVRVGDIVIATRLIQHDVDPRPLMPRYEIPFLGVTWFETDKGLVEKARRAATHLLAEEDKSEVRRKFGITSPRVILGDIACGDQFIGSHQAVNQLSADIPSLQCVEMEGAAVAQVCYEYDIPFVVIRSISDNANDDALVDFMAYIDEVANHYSVEIVKRMLS